MALRTTVTKLGGLSSWLKSASGYRQYGLDCNRSVLCNVPGLHREDLIMEHSPGVKEALRRLPQDVVNARYFRLKRVRVHLSV